MKKNKLVIEYEYAFDLLGITSSVKFYKLAWAVNKQLFVELTKQEDFILDVVPEAQVYEFYAYPESEPHLWLYRNRSVSNDTKFLIPEFPHFDFILKISSESQSFAIKEISKVLRDVDLIEYIGALEVESLKSRDNFLE